MKTDSITRREFLKMLGLVGGGLMLAGCGSQLSPADTTPATPEPSKTPAPSATPSEQQEATATPTSSITPTSQPETGYLPILAPGETFALPVPFSKGSVSLMDALLQRHSERTFGQEELPVQMLSDLLWAGFGINRPESNGRTAPSAHDFRDVDIYLATTKGLLLYKAESQSLKAILPDDVRSYTGTQAFAATVPVNFVYVSDYSRMSSASIEDRERWSWAHSGCIAQNVYLACASEGLVTVVRSTINRAQLASQMELDENQHITLAQSIGFPMISVNHRFA